MKTKDNKTSFFQTWIFMNPDLNFKTRMGRELWTVGMYSIKLLTRSQRLASNQLLKNEINYGLIFFEVSATKVVRYVY